MHQEKIQALNRDNSQRKKVEKEDSKIEQIRKERR